MTLNVLHLSDLHFGELHHWGTGSMPKLDEAIIDMLKNHNDQIHVLIMSGDFTSEGKEYYPVKHFLSNLLKASIFNNLRDIITVPGNHDFPFYDEHHAIINNVAERERDYRMFNSEMIILKNGLPKYDCTLSKKIVDKFKDRIDEHLINISCNLQEDEEIGRASCRERV